VRLALFLKRQFRRFVQKAFAFEGYAGALREQAQ
jgi:hypothetical protein